MQRGLGFPAHVGAPEKSDAPPTPGHLDTLQHDAKLTITGLQKTPAKSPRTRERGNPSAVPHTAPMTEIIFEVREDEGIGGYGATAFGHTIVAQGATLEELRDLARDAGQCPFGDGVPGEMPRIVRRHFGRDEMLALCESAASSPGPDVARAWRVLR